MVREEFYLTLPSNSNLELYPTNHGGEYTVVLNEPLNLDAMWQVGLAEAVYTRDWDNVRKGENEILFEYGPTKEEVAQLSLKYHILCGSNAQPGIEDGHDFDQKKTYADVLQAYESVASELTKIMKSVSRHKAAQLPDADYPKMEVTVSTGAAIFKMGKIGSKLGNIDFTFKFNSAFQQVYGLPATLHFTAASPTHTITLSPIMKAFGTGPVEFKAPGMRGELTSLEPKRYFTPASLVAEFNTACAKLKKATIKATLVPLAKADHQEPAVYRIKLEITSKINTGWWRLHISPPLSRLLGISQHQQNLAPSGYRYIQPESTPVDMPSAPPTTFPTPTKVSFEGDFDVDIYRDVDALWVYTDIIEGQITGNTRSPLLRILPASSKQFGQSEVVVYEAPQYKRLNNVVIQRVNVAIYNSQGKETIDFKQPVVVTLHFIKG